MVLAQLFEKSIILKYLAEPAGATTYLKTLYFPTACTIPRNSVCGSAVAAQIAAKTRQIKAKNRRLQMTVFQRRDGVF